MSEFESIRLGFLARLFWVAMCRFGFARRQRFIERRPPSPDGSIEYYAHATPKLTGGSTWYRASEVLRDSVR